jgi:hypothetical protein
MHECNGALLKVKALSELKVMTQNEAGCYHSHCREDTVLGEPLGEGRGINNSESLSRSVCDSEK